MTLAAQAPGTAWPGAAALGAQTQVGLPVVGAMSDPTPTAMQPGPGAAPSTPVTPQPTVRQPRAAAGRRHRRRPRWSRPADRTARPGRGCARGGGHRRLLAGDPGRRLGSDHGHPHQHAGHVDSSRTDRPRGALVACTLGRDRAGGIDGHLPRAQQGSPRPGVGDAVAAGSEDRGAAGARPGQRGGRLPADLVARAAGREATGLGRRLADRVRLRDRRSAAGSAGLVRRQRRARRVASSPWLHRTVSSAR